MSSRGSFVMLERHPSWRAQRPYRSQQQLVGRLPMPWDVVSTSGRPMRLEIDEVFRLRVVHGMLEHLGIRCLVCCFATLDGWIYTGKFFPSSKNVFCEVVKEQVKWIKDFTGKFGISKVACMHVELIWIPSRTKGGGM